MGQSMRSGLLAIAVPGALAAATAATATSPMGPPILGKWRIERIRGADSLDSTKASFEVASDGRVATTIGCNRMVGQPKFDDKTISFGPMAMTRMACPPPLDRLEQGYAAALADVRSYTVEGDTFTLLDGKGEPVVLMMREH